MRPGLVGAAEPRARLGVLALGALGVVFGDIGTSPLYALQAAFSPENHLRVSQANVLVDPLSVSLEPDPRRHGQVHALRHERRVSYSLTVTRSAYSWWRRMNAATNGQNGTTRAPRARMSSSAPRTRTTPIPCPSR